MAKIGTCRNCKRPEMSLPQDNLCGACAVVYRKYRTEPALLELNMARIAEKLAISGKQPGHKKAVKEAKPEGKPAAAKATKAEANPEQGGGLDARCSRPSRHRQESSITGRQPFSCRRNPHRVSGRGLRPPGSVQRILPQSAALGPGSDPIHDRLHCCRVPHEGGLLK